MKEKIDKTFILNSGVFENIREEDGKIYFDVRLLSSDEKFKVEEKIVTFSCPNIDKISISSFETKSKEIAKKELENLLVCLSTSATKSDNKKSEEEKPQWQSLLESAVEESLKANVNTIDFFLTTIETIKKHENTEQK